MNLDQVKGAAKNVAGKIQQMVGEPTGNKTQQAKGAAKQRYMRPSEQRSRRSLTKEMDKMRSIVSRHPGLTVAALLLLAAAAVLPRPSSSQALTMIQQ